MNKDNLSFGMKVVIVIFVVILALSLMLPFFSQCSAVSQTTTYEEEDTKTASSLSTVADVNSAYADRLATLSAKYEDSSSLLSVANLGNMYMEWGAALQAADDASANEDTVQAAYAQAVSYYDAYLEMEPTSSVVKMNRALSLYYSGQQEDGLAALQAVADEHPDFSPALYYLGSMYEESGDYYHASVYYDAAYTADMSNSYNMAYSAVIRKALLSSLQDSSASSSSDAAGAGSSSKDVAASLSADGTVGGVTQDSSSASSE